MGNTNITLLVITLHVKALRYDILIILILT